MTEVAAHARTRLEQHGKRLTRQRRAVLDVIAELGGHRDAEEIHRAVNARQGMRVGLTTIYRTLGLLTEVGVLARQDFGVGRSVYEMGARAHHDHLVDVDTGECIEFADAEIERRQRLVAERLGYELVGHELILRGRVKNKS